MTLLNFPSTDGKPTDGSFTYTANGVVYSWDGEKWLANNESALNTKYVQVSGDTMTGRLDIGSIDLDVDGTAVFGSVNTMAFYPGGTNGNGWLQVKGSTYTVGSYPAIIVRDKDDTTLASITYGGGATFAEKITSGTLVDSSTDWTGDGVSIYGAGVIYAGRSSGSGNIFVGRQAGVSTPTSTISAAGAATFSGNVSAEGAVDNSGGGRIICGRSASSTATDRSGVSLYGQGSSDGGRITIQSKSSYSTTAPAVEIYRGASSVYKIDYAGSANFSNVNFNLESDNPANFNAEGEYTGPTLDVKDSLTKLIAAITAIRTASQTSGTLEDLKTAITTATADFDGGN